MENHELLLVSIGSEDKYSRIYSHDAMTIGTCKQKNYVSCGGLSMQKIKPVSRKKVGSATQIQASKHGSKLSFNKFYCLNLILGAV